MIYASSTGVWPWGGRRQGYGRSEGRRCASYSVATWSWTGTGFEPMTLAAGQLCPACGRGTLDSLPAGVEIRIDGNTLLSAVRYELEKLRVVCDYCCPSI